MNSKDRFTRVDVMAIPAPPFTKTWHPIPHREVIEGLQKVVDAKGIGIRQETYSVTNKGNNMFGAWTLDVEQDGKYVQVGFRNSISKDFAVGICAGTFVVVCSNMQFRGEFVEFRKHTSGLDPEEILLLGSRAFNKVLDEGRLLIEWQNQLRDYPLTSVDFKCITFDAMREGIFGANHFNAFLNAHGEEARLAGEHSLYTFHGAVTRMIRGINLFSIDERTRTLANLCDAYAIEYNVRMSKAGR